MIPMEMQAFRASATRPGAADAIESLRLERVAVPTPGPGQVLVRMRAAPCNPADLLYLTGQYGIDRPLPATPGFEGAGEVVASGGGMLARWMMNKRVAAGGHRCSGTWAEYCVADATQCLPLKKELSFEQGATALVNPMTAFALVSLARKGGHRAIVQTGAAGQLGRMIATVAKRAGMGVINVVRRDAQAVALRAAGSEALASEAPDFVARLSARSRELGATIALDAVAGSMTGILLGALPRNGEVVIYGALSGEPSGAIDPMQVAFGAKRIRGFELDGHLKAAGILGSFRLASKAQRFAASGDAPGDIRARVKLDAAKAELVRYVREMSSGKVLITPAP